MGGGGADGVESTEPAARATSGCEPGTAIDRFTIVRLLGAGGMGAVYAARDPDAEARLAELRGSSSTPVREE